MSQSLGSPFVYLAGVFNGRRLVDSFSSHRAAVPATLNYQLQAPGLSFVGGAIDFENAVYYQRWLTENGEALVEQRWYAHAVYRTLMVHEVVPIYKEVLLTRLEGSNAVQVQASSNLTSSPDIDFQPSGPNTWFGFINETEETTSAKVGTLLAHPRGCLYLNQPADNAVTCSQRN